MLYHLLDNKHLHTAGKITVATAFLGVVVVAFVFLFNAGKTELMKVDAQSAATTTLTVLNTPPQWTQLAVEEFESSATNPTNSGTAISWVAVGNDPNGASIYLLVCSTSATPTPANSAAPSCSSGTQWGVSAPTLSGNVIRVSTTTQEASPFSATNTWFAWICDNDPVSARCNNTYSTGTNATNSSPFVMNYRPTFSAFSDTSPANPGASITFNSTSSDPDGNTVRLIVCSTGSFATATDSCVSTTLATTTTGVASNAAANYTLGLPLRDTNYDAFGYVIDQFGHEALGGAQGTNSIITVNNVAPTVSTSSISINGGLDIPITVAGGQTTGLTLSFETADDNSCRNISNNLEIVNYGLSLYRSGVGSSSCEVFDAADYNPNNCYTASVPTTTWNISCTASTTSCDLGGSDRTLLWSCTYPLWFVTEPTDAASTTPYSAQNWLAQVAAIDDNNATGTPNQSGIGVDVVSFTFLDLLTGQIAYGEVEPGFSSGSGLLAATTTIRSLGNTALDQDIQGESMCGSYTVSTECPVSATSTIPEDQQRFATSSVTYGSGTTLSSTTIKELELNVRKSTSTLIADAARGVTYWGIFVPGTISLAGSYTGLNTFYARAGEPTDW